MKKAMFLFLFSLITLWLTAQYPPEWLWAKQAGGTDVDYGRAIATDSSGNNYITGSFYGTATFGSTSLTSSGDRDIFIAKLDANGNYLWANQAGGTGYDSGYSISTDSSGYCYVSGGFEGTATFGSTTITNSGGSPGFIVKLDTNGNYLWAKQTAGSITERSPNIVSDSNGNIYVTGIFHLQATFGTTTLTSSGYSDIFIAKLDTNGNWLWAKQAGGMDDGVYGFSIATDSSGNSYVTGVFQSIATFGTTTLYCNGNDDIFIAKLDTSGNWLWAKQAGGVGYDYGWGIATNSSENSFVTGSFEGTISFGNITLTSSGERDIFTVKLDANGSFLWAKKAGGTCSDGGSGITTDSSGNSYVTGGFEGTATFGSITLTSSGDFDIFIAKLDANGSFLWAKKAGGTFSDGGSGITTDSNGFCYVTGVFTGIATFGTTSLTSSGESDIFIAKLSNSTEVSDEYGSPQANFSLGQNHPNPFSASTSFTLEVSDAKSVYEVSVYDLRGRHVHTLHRGVLPVGMSNFTWNGKDAADNELSSGVYFYRVSDGISSQVKKVIYLR